MRTSVQLTADSAPWPESVDFVTGAEALGVDAVWVAEAWGSDAASPLDTVRLYPAGDTVTERLDTLGRALDLVP